MATGDADELTEHLHEQLDFLRSHAATYDGGKRSFAKPLATTLRVLLHHTASPKNSKGSQALLHQLGVLDSMLFLDSGGEVEDHMLTGWTMVSLRLTAGQDADYEPILAGGRPRMLLPVRDQVRDILSRGRKPHRAGDWLPFADWWSSAILRDDQPHTFSRKDVVLALANKEGGAHIDSDVSASYRRLSRSNSLGWQYSVGGDVLAMGNPVPATLRQIAYEVEVSLLRQFPELGDQ